MEGGVELMSQPKREGATGGALRAHSARNIARSSGGRKNNTSLLAWIHCVGEIKISRSLAEHVKYGLNDAHGGWPDR